jgi:hypothetical protein
MKGVRPGTTGHTRNRRAFGGDTPPDSSPSIQEGGSGGAPRSKLLVFLAVAIIVGIVGAAAFAFLPGPGEMGTTSTFYPIGPSVILSRAVLQNPAGYSLESSKLNPSIGTLSSGDWVVLGHADGSVANLTAVVYSTTNGSRSYYDRLVANLKGLQGYADISFELASYQQYGRCYGYGEDVDGIAVADGVCTNGNVLLHVHLVSGKAFSDLEADLTAIMGALFASVR